MTWITPDKLHGAIWKQWVDDDWIMFEWTYPLNAAEMYRCYLIVFRFWTFFLIEFVEKTTDEMAN